MNKKNLKILLLLLIIIFVLEVLNVIVYSLFNFFIIPKIFPAIISGEKIDVLSHLFVTIFAIITYYIIGKKIFINIDSKNAKCKIAIVLAIIIVISYLIINFFVFSDLFIAIHWDFFSPVAYTLLLPLQFSENNIPFLFELLLILLSPISVLLIWLFSKIGDKKKKQSDSDV